MDKKQLFIGVIIGVLTATVVQLLIFRFCRPFGLPPPRDLKHLVQRFANELSLTDQQIKQLRPAMVEFHRTMQDSRRAQLDLVRGAMDKLDSTIEAALDDSQKERFKKMRSRFDRLRGAEGMPPPPEEDREFRD